MHFLKGDCNMTNKGTSQNMRRLVRPVVMAVALCGSLGLGLSAHAADEAAARAELKKTGVEYTEQQFASSAGAGDMVAVKLFLDGGMDVNAGGSAALGVAAGRGKLEMVKFLLSKGAKPTSNALQFARTRGHKEIEEILVKAGAKE